MNVSIGILAHNESDLIAKMLHSLFQQSLFQQLDPKSNIEIVIVPNGCTDDTADVARKTLNDLVKPSLINNVNYIVHEIEQPGKSNAWNVYVHQLSNPRAKYLFLMDSDILLLNYKTLSSMINVLDTRLETWLAVDKPIKDVSLKKNKNLMEHLSSSVSRLSGGQKLEGEPAWICGQLYCAQAEILRQIWLPINLHHEDSFLYTMVVTEGLRLPKNPYRVILASSASHVFEAYTDISRLLRHEKWLIIGSAINELIYNYLLSDENKDKDPGLLIKGKNEENSQWLNQLIQEAIAEKGWWIIPRFILIRRFLSLLDKSLYKSIGLFPLALIAFSVDLWLSLQANIDLHQGKGIDYWDKNETPINN